MTILGLLGLIPFFACAGVVAFAPPILPAAITSYAPATALIYGAVIAAYLAGAHAGAMFTAPASENRRFLLGQVLLLVAFFAALAPGAADEAAMAIRHIVVAGVLLALWAQDRAAVGGGALPAWYGRLRTMLTAGAVGSLLVISASLFFRSGF